MLGVVLAGFVLVVVLAGFVLAGFALVVVLVAGFAIAAGMAEAGTGVAWRSRTPLICRSQTSRELDMSLCAESRGTFCV